MTLRIRLAGAGAESDKILMIKPVYRETLGLGISSNNGLNN